MKLRAFELTCLSFVELTQHLESIQKKEGDLGAKLLEPDFHIQLDFSVKASNRLRVETLVLQEYYEEMKINLKREEENADYKSRKIDRTRIDMP